MKLIILKCTVQCFLVYSQSCTTITTNFRIFSPPEAVPLYFSLPSAHDNHKSAFHDCGFAYFGLFL